MERGGEGVEGLLLCLWMKAPLDEGDFPCRPVLEVEEEGGEEES